LQSHWKTANYVKRDAWDGFDAVDTLSNGSLATTPPRHVHIQTANGKPVGRLNLETMTGLEGWQPDKKLLQVIDELRREGRL